MRKKTSLSALLLPLAVILACFCGCSVSRAETPAALLRAVAAKNPAYAFAPEDLFYKDGVYYAFYSLHAPDDLLLSLRVDETQTVVRAAVTAKTGSEAAKRDLAPLGTLVAALLLPESDPDALAAATGLALLPDPPPDVLNEYPCGSARAVLFRGKTALSFFVELQMSEAASR